MMDLMVLSRYPFLEDAKKYVKNEGATIKELLEDPLFEPARTFALDRLQNAYERKDIGTRSLSTESDYLMELFSYPIARMITVCINDTFFTKRYALGEAVHIYKNLLKEPLVFLLSISKEFDLSIKYNEEMNKPALYFTHFLRYAPNRYKTWKMINRVLDQGYVTVTKKDLSRIIQEAIRERINKELEQRTCNEKASRIFSSEIASFRNKVAAQRKKNEAIPLGKLNVSFLPPCLKHILLSIQAGENVPHMGRFALVAFLNSLQLSVNEILELFSTAPDFEEDKTRYQIEHILGKTGATSYKAPGCDKLKTFGLCPSEERDDICKKSYHPISYYRQRWKQAKNEKNSTKKDIKNT
jgi:DNA primase large subunit